MTELLTMAAQMAVTCVLLGATVYVIVRYGVLRGRP